MIIIYLGGIGSGKSLSVCKKIIDNPDVYAYTNFKLKHTKNYYRLKKSDILTKLSSKQQEKLMKKHDKKKLPDKLLYDINWQFWNKVMKTHSKYSIFLDEVYNLIHSRRSMSTTNILMSKWVSQIRKILSDSEYNHLYLISQTIRKIDIDFRELAEYYVQCQKIQIKDKIYILQRWYHGIDGYERGISVIKNYFLANPYFKYYDTKEIINFKDESEVYV